MDRDRLQDELADLALEEDQAHVYVALLELGSSKARTVADETGIHRSTAYRILKKLAEKGIVDVGVGRPMKFTAAPPERLFEELRRRKARELDRVEEAEDALTPALDRIAGEGDPGGTGGERWQMIQGRDRILDRAVDVLEEAEEEIRYLSTDPIASEGRGESDVDWETPLARRAPDLDARFLVNPDRLQDEALEALMSIEGLQVRVRGSEARARSCLIDGEAFVWVVVGAEPEEDVALWSDASDLYTSQRLLFDGLWEGAQVPQVRR